MLDTSAKIASLSYSVRKQSLQLKRLYRARGNMKDVASCKPPVLDLSVEN